MILIITNRHDATVEFVERELRIRDKPFVRLNTDDFPVNSTAIVDVTNGSTHAAVEFHDGRPSLDFGTVRSVWYRRPVPPVVAASIDDEGVRKFSIDESYECLRGMWYTLDCYWMSRPETIRCAEHKIVQLKAAIACGFVPPRTVVTNCPDRLRALWHSCPSGLVAKPLYRGFVEGEQFGGLIYTTRLKESHIADDSAIRAAPAIFQEFIAKVADVRVTVVGETVFATRIDARNLPDHIPDWRYAQTNLDHATHKLPREIQDRCIHLVKLLGLDFGAIDFALTDDGRHVFLEINPNGQWAWLESATGCPISAAIAERLAANA